MKICYWFSKRCTLNSSLNEPLEAVIGSVCDLVTMMDQQRMFFEVTCMVALGLIYLLVRNGNYIKLFSSNWSEIAFFY